MPWHATVHPELPVVETCYSGVLTASELSDAVRETLTLARTHGRTRLLGDCTTLAGGHSLVDLYDMADAVASSGMAEVLRGALLLPALPASAENVRFWETTCYNRGLRVQVFEDRQHALEWLLEAWPS